MTGEVILGPIGRLFHVFAPLVVCSSSLLNKSLAFSYSPVAFPRIRVNSGNFFEPNSKNKPMSIMMTHSVPAISITSGSIDIIRYLEIVITGIKHFRKYFYRHLVQPLSLFRKL